MQHLLLTSLLLFAARSFDFPQAPSAQQAPGQVVAPNSTAARIDQYYRDLTQRLRDVYFAPSDGRAIALLSTGTTEFGARKKALQQEILRLPQKPTTAEQQNWTKEMEAITTSAAATKLADRCQRNPALATALKRFEDAQLTTLGAQATH